MFFPIKVNYSFQLNQLKNNTRYIQETRHKTKKPRALYAANRTGSVHRKNSSKSSQRYSHYHFNASCSTDNPDLRTGSCLGRHVADQVSRAQPMPASCPTETTIKFFSLVTFKVIHSLVRFSIHFPRLFIPHVAHPSKVLLPFHIIKYNFKEMKRAVTVRVVYYVKSKSRNSYHS